MRELILPTLEEQADLGLLATPLAFEIREEIWFDDGHSKKKTFDSGFWAPNALTNEGQASILNVWAREQTNPSKYLLLLNMPSTTPTKTTTMATMTESSSPGSNGYNRQALAAGDWSTPALDSGDQQIQSAQETFGAFTGNVPVSHVAGATVSTGTAGLLLFYVPTAYFTANAAARTFVSGESYLVTLRDKQI